MPLTTAQRTTPAASLLHFPVASETPRLGPTANFAALAPSGKLPSREAFGKEIERIAKGYPRHFDTTLLAQGLLTDAKTHDLWVLLETGQSPAPTMTRKKGGTRPPFPELAPACEPPAVVDSTASSVKSVSSTAPLEVSSQRDSSFEPKVVAFLVASVQAFEAEILWLAVDPAHAREGLGKRLLTELSREARARSPRLLHLAAKLALPESLLPDGQAGGEGWLETARFYEANGFTFAHRLEDYWGMGDHAALYLRRFERSWFGYDVLPALPPLGTPDEGASDRFPRVNRAIQADIRQYLGTMLRTLNELPTSAPQSTHEGPPRNGILGLAFFPAEGTSATLFAETTARVRQEDDIRYRFEFSPGNSRLLQILCHAGLPEAGVVRYDTPKFDAESEIELGDYYREFVDPAYQQAPFALFYRRHPAAEGMLALYYLVPAPRDIVYDKTIWQLFARFHPGLIFDVSNVIVRLSYEDDHDPAGIERLLGCIDKPPALQEIEERQRRALETSERLRTARQLFGAVRHSLFNALNVQLPFDAPPLTVRRVLKLETLNITAAAMLDESPATAQEYAIDWATGGINEEPLGVTFGEALGRPDTPLEIVWEGDGAPPPSTDPRFAALVLELARNLVKHSDEEEQAPIRIELRAYETLSIRYRTRAFAHQARLLRRALQKAGGNREALRVRGQDWVVVLLRRLATEKMTAQWSLREGCEPDASFSEGLTGTLLSESPLMIWQQPESLDLETEPYRSLELEVNLTGLAGLYVTTSDS